MFPSMTGANRGIHSGARDVFGLHFRSTGNRDKAPEWVERVCDTLSQSEFLKDEEFNDCLSNVKARLDNWSTGDTGMLPALEDLVHEALHTLQRLYVEEGDMVHAGDIHQLRVMFLSLYCAPPST